MADTSGAMQALQQPPQGRAGVSNKAAVHPGNGAVHAIVDFQQISVYTTTRRWQLYNMSAAMWHPHIALCQPQPARAVPGIAKSLLLIPRSIEDQRQLEIKYVCTSMQEIISTEPLPMA
jgi:hypothetical protein